MTTGSDLLWRLRGLEVELHRLETRQNSERLDQLLHPDFVEFARNGHRYSRSEVLAEFSRPGATLEPVHVDRFEVAEITRGSVLVTYSSAHETANGQLYRCTLRSSLWVETETGWRLRFHQGTPIDEVPSA
jgi:hypothetical protein